jgi:two-component system response regulator (stage 0 sporulation protein F)
LKNTFLTPFTGLEIIFNVGNRGLSFFPANLGKVREMNRMGSRAKVLIVEDDDNLRFLYSEELREEGYEPILAKNGKEAMKILKKLKPDLIILDIVMPVMDGMEALGRIIGQYRDLPIILYSNYPHYKEDFMSWAADAYLTKSSDLTELKKVVRNLLKRKLKIIDENPFPKRRG